MCKITTNEYFVKLVNISNITKIYIGHAALQVIEIDKKSLDMTNFISSIPTSVHDLHLKQCVINASMSL